MYFIRITIFYFILFSNEDNEKRFLKSVDLFYCWTVTIVGFRRKTTFELNDYVMQT